MCLLSGLCGCYKPDTSPLPPPKLEGVYELIGVSSHYYLDSNRTQWPKAYYDSLNQIQGADSLLKIKSWRQHLEIDSAKNYYLMHFAGKRPQIFERGILKLDGPLITSKGSFHNFRISFLGTDSMALERAFNDSSFVAIKSLEFRKVGGPEKIIFNK